MTLLLQHFGPLEWFTLGILAGVWIVARGNNQRGRRVGAVEQDMREALALLSQMRDQLQQRKENGP